MNDDRAGPESLELPAATPQPLALSNSQWE